MCILKERSNKTHHAAPREPHNLYLLTEDVIGKKRVMLLNNFHCILCSERGGNKTFNYFSVFQL